MPKGYDRTKTALFFFLAGMLAIASGWLVDSEVLAHGGKTHGGESFTALQALQKATGLYDRLVVEGKLDESWETDLTTVTVTTRDKDGRKEYRVVFQRRNGRPEAVYIYFSSDGTYSGSNFTGQW